MQVELCYESHCGTSAERSIFDSLLLFYTRVVRVLKSAEISLKHPRASKYRWYYVLAD